MNLTGKQEFRYNAQAIWDILMDADQLAAITPGVSELEKVEEDIYKAISNIKIGPVKGSFAGDLKVIDKLEPEKFTLNVQQKSKIGNVNAEVRIALQATNPELTTLSFDGKAKLSGLLARTGQRVLSGVANSLTRQFFEALDKTLENSENNTNT
jgi:carbon monoxide dehydrogenase subunit G